MQAAAARTASETGPRPKTVARANARWYFSGLSASLLGNSAMTLVAGVWVKTMTGSSAQAGLVSACEYAATMAAPIGGLIADRVARRPLLLWLNLVAAATIMSLVLVTGRSGTWLVFAAMAAYGIEGTLMDPAEDALFAQMFTTDFRRRINGLRLMIQETGRLAAPLLGAGLFVLAGGGAVAALDAATFVFAALVLTRLRVDDTPSEPTPERLSRALAGGVRHILSSPEIRLIAIAATAVMALSGVGVAAQYSLVHGVGERPAFLGVFSALLGGGSIIASVTASPLIKRFGERRLALIGLVNFAAGNLLRANHWLAAALLGSTVLGFALPYVFLATLSIAQRETPNRLQGRVSAALLFALFGPQAVMQITGAALIARTGYIEIYVASAAIGVGIAVWLAAQRRLPASGIR